MREQANKLQSELLEEQNNIKNDERLIIEKNNKIASNQKSIESLKKDNDEISKKYLSVVDELTKSEDEAEQNQQMMISALDKLSDIKADISKLGAEKLASMDKLAELKAEENSSKQSLLSMQNTLASVKGELSQKTLEQAKTEQILTELSQKLQQNNAIYNSNSDKFSELNSTYASLIYRKNMLEDMQKNFDGFNGAVKHILTEAEKNSKLKDSFVGVVANLMKVPEKYKTAVEMALGATVQNIVTLDEQHAEDIIAYLKQNNFGRATFLPLTSLKPRSIASYVGEISKESGYFGVASELISYDSKLSNIFENLLGNTAVVDTLVTAVKIAKQTRYAFKIVTLDGDVINPQGSITGGSKNKNIVSVIGREAEIEELAKNLQKLQLEKSNLSADIANTRANLEELQDKINITNIHNSNLKVDIAKLSESENQLLSNITQTELELEEIETSIKEVSVKIKAIEQSLAQNDELKSSIDGNKQNANKSIEKRQQNFENLKKERDEYNSKVMDIKINIASLESENVSLLNDIERIKTEIEQKTAKVEQINAEIANNAEIIAKAESVISATQQDADYVETNNKLTEVKSKLDSLGEYKNSLQAELKVLDENRLNLTTRVNKLQDKLFQENVNLTKIDTDIENMQERVETEYGLNYSSAMEYKRENYDLEEGLKTAAETKKAIDRLGYVNVNAIEDSKIYQERFDTYSVQVADLTKAENDLTKIIADLANEMLTRFQTSFDTINMNFNRVFKELFGGGNATLELVPSESGNELEAGVDIKVEPPGKKLQSITLLSGGEKSLTAIAILFAILKLRPMPFVLLDEIEAALDDANVGRFAKYLQKFSAETQFIVITHRKPTMELADNLYGVTMPEKGVSKVVSVKLSEAMAVDNAAGAQA